MVLLIHLVADYSCRALAAGTWPTQWRRTRRRQNTTYFPGRWGKTGGGVFPASSGSGTSCGLASTIGLQSAEPAAKRQLGTDFVSYIASCSCLLKSFHSYPSPKVMAICPSHFAWQRERSEKHSGAQRRYGDKTFSLPRNRTASQAPCSLCDRISTASQQSGSSLDPRISPEVSTQLLAVELTPPGDEARKMLPRRRVSRCSVEDFQASSRCRKVSSRIVKRGGRRAGW